MEALGALRILAGVLAACLTAGDAAAGAWTLARGDGQLIMTSGRRIAPVGAFFGSFPDADSNTAQVFVEYGAADGWTVGGTLWSEFSSVDPQALEMRLGAHVRRRVWAGARGDVASVQAGIAAPVERWVLGSALSESLPGSVPEAHLRALYGRGWQWGMGNSFVSTEAGFHWRGEGAAEEIRVDVTAGHEGWKGVLGLLGIYSGMPLGGGGDASLKLAPSVALTLWPRPGRNDKKPFGALNPSTVQLGLTWDVLNPQDGLGVTVGVWRRF